MELHIVKMVAENSPYLAILFLIFFLLRDILGKNAKLLVEIKELIGELVVITKKERYDNGRFKEYLTKDIQDSNSQHTKIETLLEVIHADTNKK
jgi:hypothetical protein